MWMVLSIRMLWFYFCIYKSSAWWITSAGNEQETGNALTHFLCGEGLPVWEQTVFSWNLSSQSVSRGLTPQLLFLPSNPFLLASQTFHTFLPKRSFSSSLCQSNRLVMFASRFLCRFSFCCSQPARLRIYTVSLTCLRVYQVLDLWSSLNV